jgi:hygromycin-B 4-O-kinase
VRSKDEPAQEIARVEAILVDVRGRAPDAAAFLAEGAWSRAFAFRDEDGDFVLRLSALDEDFHKDRLAARHRSPALPIPAFVDMGRTDTGFYAITERVPGGEFETADEATIRSRLPSLFAALDAMRSIDVSDTTGFGIWNANGKAPHGTWRDALLAVAVDHEGRRDHGWRDRLAASAIGIDPFETAFAVLAELVADLPEIRHLVHSDLANRNVLAVGDRLTGVLDWGSSIYGDFLFDIAWLSFCAMWYPNWGGIDFVAEARRHYAEIALEVPAFDDRLRAYQIYIGLDSQAYQARFGFTVDLKRTAQRTLDIARGRQPLVGLRGWSHLA